MQQQKSISVTLNEYSQPHVLRHRMLENQLTHGQTVMADLSPVRVEPGRLGEPVMFFCPMRRLDVIKQIEPGDGCTVPLEATLKGIKLPAHLRPGLYNLKNVMLHSNGTMQVIATDKTQFEPYNHDERVLRVGMLGCAEPEIVQHRSYGIEREIIHQGIRTMNEQSEIEYRMSGRCHHPF